MGDLMGATLSVDDTRCTGHGRCYSVSPNLLSDDEEGMVTLRGSSMPISDDQLADAEEAVAACPERAITLTRTP
jgi:ferredoxin